MPALILGPMLRYADDSCATVWVETDAPCEVRIQDAATRTFTVCGHHYAILALHGLQPGVEQPYTVTLDGEVVWPEPGSPFPPSVIRTRAADEALRLVVGSCRASRPNRPPYSLPKGEHELGVGGDALRALALRMLRGVPQEWPHGMLLVGDQVYADEVSPQTLEFLRARRDTTHPPGEEVADFEEYTQLYREAWSEPLIRWLFSVVPSAMIFDDHDVHDDWNTSAAWRREHQATAWWSDRIIGAISSYWIYQHLGNLMPPDIAQEGVLARLYEVEDGWPVLHDLAIRADSEADGHKGHRWSYRRDRGSVRLVVIDSRCGRVLDGRREMVDAREWDWLAQQMTGDVDHLLLVSSLPVLLPEAISSLESWNEAVCAGAWGGLAARVGEKVRQGVDLEHWAAFRDSLERLLSAVADVSAGRRGRPPGSIVFLSGDVHYAYLAQLQLPKSTAAASPVYQVVSSPIRNPISRGVQRADRFARSRFAGGIGRLLARAARVPDSPYRWDLCQGPWFDNNLAMLELDGRELTVAFAVVREEGPSELAQGEDDPRLETVWGGELVRRPLPGNPG